MSSNRSPDRVAVAVTHHDHAVRLTRVVLESGASPLDLVPRGCSPVREGAAAKHGAHVLPGVPAELKDRAGTEEGKVYFCLKLPQEYKRRSGSL